MKSLTCIVCPVGCTLDTEADTLQDTISVTGNRCPRGTDYALEEIRAPKRVVTATVKLEKNCTCKESSVRRLPVKTSSPCLREKIPALLDDIYKIKVSLPVKAGDVIIADWKGEGINIVATRTID